MKTQKRRKGNILRLTAMMLVVVGVLTALPASALAAWKYNWIVRGSATNKNFTGINGTSSVELKYFAENVYAGPAGAVTYNYYQYDPNAAENNYISTSGNAELDSFAGTPSDTFLGASYSGTMNVITSEGSNLTVSAGTQKDYCDCGHSNSTCNHEKDDYAKVEFKHENYGLSLTFGDFSIDDFYSGSPTWNAALNNPKSTTFVENTQNVLIPLGDSGKELVVTVNYRIWFEVTATKTDTSATCGGYKLLGLISMSCGEKCHRYSGTSTLYASATYTAYIRETTAEYPAVWDKKLHHIKADGESNGVMYTLSGLSSSDLVTLPSYETLQALIPKIPASDKEGDPRLLYETLLYPIGYYVNTDIENNSRGTPVSFPLTNLPAGTTTVWVEWGVENPTSDGKTDLNQTIGSAQSGTINIYGKDQAGSGYHTVKNDIASLPNNTFGLYASIAKGVTVNLCLNDYGETNINALEGESPNSSDNIYQGDETVSLDNNTRDYTIALQNDITLSGNLYVGGYTGVYSNSNSKAHCYIVKNYVALDLNGHTLTIKDGAVLHSFGYIYDSVGTGKIVIETGGTLYSQLLLYGLGGLSQIMKLFDMGYCPFEDYNLAYLNATVEIKVDGEKAGNLIGFSMVYPSASMGLMFNYYMPMFSGTAKTSLFRVQSRDGRTESYVRISTVKMEDLSAMASYCYDIKHVFTFKGVQVKFTAPTLQFNIKVLIFEQSVSMNMQKVIFPISSLIDLTCEDALFELGQSAVVMPGATLTFDEKSVLRLVSGGNVEVDSVTVTATGVAGMTKHVVGRLYAPTYNLQSSQVHGSYRQGMGFGSATLGAAFWNRFGTAAVNVYGAVEFVTGVSEEYVLSGNINISSFRTCAADGSGASTALEWNAVNLKKGLENVNLQTYGSFAVCASGSASVSSGNDHTARVLHYYTLPLISNGTAYLFDAGSDLLHVGVYDSANGVFTENGTGKNYVILASTVLPDEQKTGEVTVTYTIAEANVKDEVATVGSATYVYYCGLYVPCTVATDESGAVTSCTITLTDTFSSVGGTKTLKWSSKNSRWE